MAKTMLAQHEADKLIRDDDAQLIAKHSGFIDKFLQIAERKVSILDEYGDENWEALDQEIKRCALKVAKIEGDRGGAKIKGEWRWLLYLRSTQAGKEYYWPKYRNLCTYLDKEFRAYHEKCKTSPATEAFDGLSGVAFEAYLAKLLRGLGFSDISGTPATGDQGADLLAEKAGRKIAIQAKRHAGSVGNSAVQEIVAALKFYQADEGWVITSGTFTEAARALAQANRIRLVDGQELRNFQG